MARITLEFYDGDATINIDGSKVKMTPSGEKLVSELVVGDQILVQPGNVYETITAIKPPAE